MQSRSDRLRVYQRKRESAAPIKIPPIALQRGAAFGICRLPRAAGVNAKHTYEIDSCGACLKWAVENISVPLSHRQTRSDKKKAIVQGLKHQNSRRN